MLFCWKLHESYTFLFCKETLPIELVEELSWQVAPFAPWVFRSKLGTILWCPYSKLYQDWMTGPYFFANKQFPGSLILIGPNRSCFLQISVPTMRQIRTKHISQETAEAYLGRCLVGNIMFGCYWYKCDWWTFVISRYPCVLESKLPLFPCNTGWSSTQ